MKAVDSWSFRPYRPLLQPLKLPFICRLAPSETSVSLEWLGEPDAKILFRKKGGDEWSSAAAASGEAVLTGLSPDTDYEICAETASARGDIRLVRTGTYPGTVVNYLHPEDPVYGFSGHSLCSPSFVRCPQGHLLASMDVFASRAPQNLSLIFRSDDDGRTWHYVCDLFPCFWGRLFVHRGRLFIIAVSTEFGDLMIGESRDGGSTWGTPTVLLRGGCKKDADGAHRNPQPVVEYGGRLWFSLEWGHGRYASLHGSIPADADPMDAASWIFSAPMHYDPSWPGAAVGDSSGFLEGCMTVCPDGKLRNILRYQIGNCTPSYGLAVVAAVDTENPEAPQRFERMMSFPGNHSKFMIKRVPESGTYLSIVSRITGPGHENDRNLLSLVASEDLVGWRLVCDLLDERESDPKKVGFQYVDFFFEGNDLLWLCRTAINGAHNFHDANCQTFHRIENFRELLKKS
ncbi:MAG: hypothetical protein PUA83_08340 [Clostridiales bacterium]|nr:hypothetical protein [Clostridiales bacterium]